MIPEGYVGTKFRTIFASHEPPHDPRTGKLAEWAHRLAQRGVLATAMGNVSTRSVNGFLITPTGTNPTSIVPQEFVEVLGVDVNARTVTAIGAREPSSECMMHAGIYAARPEVGAVFHGHSDTVLAAAERLRIPVTEREVPYGTPEMMKEVLNILGQGDLLIMRGHGFVSLGNTTDDAGQRIEAVLEML